MPSRIEEPVAGRRTTLAYRTIRARILAGDLKPGRVLPEGPLAIELGMSKTPVRLALRTLHDEGLLDAGPRRSLVVRGFTAAHRKEILQVREGLEKIAVAHACTDMPVEEMDELRILLRRQRRAAASEDENLFIELDEEFHIRLATGSGLRVLPKFLQQLRGFVRVMRLGTVRTRGYMFRVLGEHERILDAVEQRSVPEALRALKQHLHTSNYPSAEEGGQGLSCVESADGAATRSQAPNSGRGPELPQ